MEAFLVIALIVSNIGWLIYMGRRDSLELEERKELYNRIAAPEMIVPPKEVIKQNIKSLKAVANKPDSVNIPDQYEHAAVGQVDPDLQRVDDK